MDHGYIFVYLQLPYHLHMWLAIEMLAGACTQRPNDRTQQPCLHSQNHKQVRATFILSKKTKSDIHEESFRLLKTKRLEVC